MQNHFAIWRYWRSASLRSNWARVMGMSLGVACLLHATTLFGAETAAAKAELKPFPVTAVITFLFLMLGPIKIIGPYVKVTAGADAVFARRLAFRATAFSSVALLLAAFLGESFLLKYGIPLPVLALTAGIILFLVALQTIMQQFSPPAQGEVAATAPTLSMAITPIAFPTIVTPYGIAALIVFIALSPTIEDKLIVGTILLGIMLLNMVAMLLARHILRFMGVFLQILGAVLGIIQVALGLNIILVFLKRVWM